MFQGLITDAPQTNARELILAKQMGDRLHTAYPGHLWAVTVSEKQGIATIRDLYLSGIWGYVLKLSDHYTASDWDQQVMHAGGEILERYRVRRGAVNQGEIAALPTDFAGRHKADF